MIFPTRDEILRKFGSGVTVAVVCRKPALKPPPPPGARRGYLCAVCGTELEATRAGQDQIASGGIPLCGPCGVSIAEEAAEAGRLGGVCSTPEAEASLDRNRAPLAPRIDRLRKAYPFPEGES